MYGWRGRIGVIIPADNAVMEPEFHRLVPEGVSAHAARLKKCPRPEMPIEALELVKTFNETHVNLVAYMCAASSFVMGPKGNADLCDKLSEVTGGLPCVTATTAMVDGLKAVGAKRVAVLSPHPRPRSLKSSRSILRNRASRSPVWWGWASISRRSTTRRPAIFTVMSGRWI